MVHPWSGKVNGLTRKWIHGILHLLLIRSLSAVTKAAQPAPLVRFSVVGWAVVVCARVTIGICRQ